MPRFTLLKLLVVPVFAEHDEDGEIVGEQAMNNGEAMAIYGFQGIEPFVAKLREQLEQVNEP